MVNAHDVARLAGVSQATVSRVLNNPDMVSAATRDRVLAAMTGIGYRPNVPARVMRTKRSGTVGLVVDDITNPFYPELIQAISAHLAAADMRMVLWDSAGPGEEAAVDAIDQRLVDGLVFTTAFDRSRALREAVRRGSPVVLVNRVVDGLPCDKVDSDNRAMARSVAYYLADAGHRRVGFIGGARGASTARTRETGFREGCRKCGLDLTVDNGQFAYDGGRAAMARLLGSRPVPTAVFCANDVSAFGALDELRYRGIGVPDDMWLVGFDDIAMASWELFSLTTVRQDLPEMAKAAVELLVARLNEPTAPPAHRRFPAALIPRRSTGFTPQRR